MKSKFVLLQSETEEQSNQSPLSEPPNLLETQETHQPDLEVIESEPNFSQLTTVNLLSNVSSESEDEPISKRIRSQVELNQSKACKNMEEKYNMRKNKRKIQFSLEEKVSLETPKID